jgi:hypothetical protein
LRVIVANDASLLIDRAPVLDVTDPRYPAGRVFLFYTKRGGQQEWYITSVDGGASWSAPMNIAGKRPGSNATHRRGRLALDSGRTLAYCSDADTVHRDSLSLRISGDGGASWGPVMLIDGGGREDHTGLCDLVDLGGGNIGVLYERDKLHEIIFTEVDGAVKIGKAVNRQQWDAVEGIYQLNGNPAMFIRFTDRDGELVANFLWGIQDSLQFLPDSGLVFIRTEADLGAHIRIRFRRGVHGWVDHVTMGNGTEWDRVDTAMLSVERLKALSGNYQSIDDPDNRISISNDSNRLVVKQEWDGARIVLTPLSGIFFFSAEPFFTLQVLSSGEGSAPKAVKILNRYNFLSAEK